ncbi:formylglycine-generating enzyme family protein [Ectothiorhodospiraceae bacterium BW-2]|nr:formylglycine-generating enzyme family protein [Ectothiorhodospiraceae bacterium BW-2]
MGHGWGLLDRPIRSNPRRVAENNPSSFKKGDNYPVEGVSWHDALDFIDKLNRQSGKNYRLPTEAEWEYAARGGTTTAYWWGDGVGRNNANCDGCGSQWDNKSTAPVGSFKPNPYGLYDTAGNVWEWTCSGKDGDYKDNMEISCKNRADSGDRAFRGGSWGNGPAGVRAAGRVGDGPDFRNFYLGFRLVLPPR